MWQLNSSSSALLDSTGGDQGKAKKDAPLNRSNRTTGCQSLSVKKNRTRENAIDSNNRDGRDLVRIGTVDTAPLLLVVTFFGKLDDIRAKGLSVPRDKKRVKGGDACSGAQRCGRSFSIFLG